ncbi:MAG: type IV pilus assembly protein PilQ [bacterium]|nr:MAG: type IV pilus assembly protein PilQ [bacterium]
MNSKFFNRSYFMQFTGVILLVCFLYNNIIALPNNTLGLQSKPIPSTATEQQSDLLSVDIKNVALKDMLKFIADNFEVEFVDSEKLPEILLTVKVADIAWQEILAAVLQAHSISYQLVDKKCYLYVNKDLHPSKISSLTLTKGQGFGDPDFKSDPISINVKNVALDEVLRFLSDNYGFNFVLNQTLKDKTVTIKVDDMPWDTMLHSVLKEQNLRYNRIGKVVYIFPA